MSARIRVAISCADRVGLVSAITGRLFDLGGNLADTTFAVLGGAAEFTSVVEFREDLDPDMIAAELRTLSPLDGATIQVDAFSLDIAHGPSARVTHRIAVSGGDRPGLIARLSKVLAQYGANIVRLEAERVSGTGGLQYVVVIAVHLPPAAADACLAAVGNTAGSLGLACDWNAVG